MVASFHFTGFTFSFAAEESSRVDLIQAIWFKKVKPILPMTGKWYKNINSLSVLSEMKFLIQYGNQKTKSSRLHENYLKCFTLQIKQAVSFCVFGQLVGNFRWWKLCLFVMDWRSSPWPCVLILFTVAALFILTFQIVPGIHSTPGIRLYPSATPQELTTIWHEKMFCTFISISNALF